MTRIIPVTLFLCACVFVVSCNKTVDTESVGTKPESTPMKKEGRVTADAAAKSALKKGDTMPGFELPDARGKIVKSRELLRESNLVVVFYRGGWCPFCNLYLKKLQDSLAEIKSAGGNLVAISAENPDDSLSTEQKNELRFHVLSDKGLEFARKLKLVFQLPDETDQKYKKKGINLVADNDLEKPELPIPATYIVNQEGKIVYDFVNPDYKKRLEPETVIRELQKISDTAAAAR